jgi:hypothetical protein
MAFTENTSELLDQDTQSIFADYDKLGVDDKLALLYGIYEAMGESITPAAPTAADPNLAPVLLGNFYQLSPEQQLDVMRQIVASEDSEYSRAYGGLTANNQLLVWFGWAQAMGNTVVDMPANYQPAQTLNKVVNNIAALDFQKQISLLREIAQKMGYSEVKPIPTQAETGKTSSL